jgi:predicted kinase
MSRLLIAMAGLPGSGKSTLSKLLAAELGALRWDKDELRQMLFPAGTVAHDGELNDFCMELLYKTAIEAFDRGAGVVILDGRPYREGKQRVRLTQVARKARALPLFIECKASVEILRSRVGFPGHIAPDRNEDLLERLASEWEPITEEHLVVDTETQEVNRSLAHVLAELQVRTSRRSGSIRPNASGRTRD